MIHSAIRSKKPAMRRLATTSIIENSSTIVAKSIELQRLLRADDAEGDHQDRADDGRAGPVDFHPRKLAEGEDEIAAEEDQVGGKNSRVRHSCCGYGRPTKPSMPLTAGCPTRPEAGSGTESNTPCRPCRVAPFPANRQRSRTLTHGPDRT